MSFRRYARYIEAATLFWMVVAQVMVVLVVCSAVQSCYATTGPVPTCAQNPWQPQCPPTVHDRRADAGR